MADPTTLIEVSGLTRDYGPLRAVDAIDLRLARGEVLGLLGPNGAGKTSTMQMLCGTIAPTAGRISINGIDLLDEPRRAKQALGYLPEDPPLYPDMTVAEYLAFVAALHGVPRRARADAIRRAVSRCGLEGTETRLVANLSKGYQQRTGIAQAVLHDPAVVILDEPTVGLDPIQIREIRALIAELGREHGVILSTHILPEVQATCSRVAIMHLGRIVFSAPMDRIGEAPIDRVLVRLGTDPGEAALRALPGITDIQGLAGGRYRLHVDPERTSPERIAAGIVEAGWGLAELSPERRTLEQIFVEATAGEPAAEAA